MFSLCIKLCVNYICFHHIAGFSLKRIIFQRFFLISVIRMLLLPPIGALLNFTLDASSSVIHNLHERGNVASVFSANWGGSRVGKTPFSSVIVLRHRQSAIHSTCLDPLFLCEKFS